MAGILDKYGIKEVADVTFYALNDNGVPTNPVLYLDTLKVSTIEQTGEEAEARGGKGNPPLLIWDYNKEITVTLEDALFSAKSLAIMFGNGTAAEFNSAGSNANDPMVMRTMEFTFSGTAPSTWLDNAGKQHNMINPKYYNAAGESVASANLVNGTKYFVTYDVAGAGSVIEISAQSFPGTYYVTGDTYARNNESGEDEFFQFIIPKAKVQSENTITLEAEGDPSTFSMNLRVLRPADGVMMKLIKYQPTAGTSVTASAKFIHNHQLAGTNAQG